MGNHWKDKGTQGKIAEENLMGTKGEKTWSNKCETAQKSYNKYCTVRCITVSKSCTQSPLNLLKANIPVSKNQAIHMVVSNVIFQL